VTLCPGSTLWGLSLLPRTSHRLNLVTIGFCPPPPCPRSYCHLETVFSIYVYGAYPLPIVPPEVTIFLLVSTILLAVWLAHMVPKMLRTERGHRFQELLTWLRSRCCSLCRCSWIWHLLRRPRGQGAPQSNPECS
jgi:cation channel sperm-associated protein subunit delta